MRELWSCQSWGEAAIKNKQSLLQVILKREQTDYGLSESEVYQAMERRLEVMEKSLAQSLYHEHKTWGGMIEKESKLMMEYLAGGNSLLGELPLKALAYSLAISLNNASMGRVVAAPTGGSAGVVPGLLLAAAEIKNIERLKLIEALIIAGGLGLVCSEKMELAGAAGGCQAECGVASGMASGALTYLLNGSTAEIFNAFALALKNLLGLSCDPVAGLVEVPCVKRNGFCTIHALTAAEMARSGIRSVIDPDQVVDAMAETGALMSPLLKETAKGGLATTKCGQKISQAKNV